MNSTSITVHWTTDKQTIGLICAGSPYSQNPSSFGPYPYNLWSDLEAGFGTTHAMTISGLPDASVPDNSPTHIAILVKDKAGNWNVSADFTVT